MNFRRLGPWLLVAILPLGCTRDVAEPTKKKQAKPDADATSLALDILRQATGVGSYRDALRLLGPELENAAIRCA